MVTVPELRLIAHRGNLRGPEPTKENRQDYVDQALTMGFEAEIDVWGSDGKLWLGHDSPQYETNFTWLEERSLSLWVHCKNVAAVDYLSGSPLNLFFHNQDALTITSQGIVWCLPGVSLPSKKFVMLSFAAEKPPIPTNAMGVCSDYLASWFS